MKIQWHVYIALVIFLLLLYMLVFPSYTILSMRPDLLLCLIVYSAFRCNFCQVMTAVAMAGLAKDFFSFQFFGLYCFVFLMIGWFIVLIRKKMMSENVFFQILLVLLFALFSHLIEAFFLFFQYRNTLAFFPYLVSALYTFMMSWILFPCFYKLKVMIHEQRS